MVEQATGRRQSATEQGRHERPGWLFDVLAWLLLAGATLAVLWPLGLTNRVLAGVDAYTYFTPYWAYRMAALRAGVAPLWNPYLFMGVPFLANPQAAVLYPLHWPLSWLASPADALAWSAIVHAWLAAGFTYTFGRRSLRLTRLAAILAGLLYGLGGFTLARVENINQLNALTWLPAVLWLYDETTVGAGGGRRRWRAGAGLAAVLALTLLAGHTQTAFVNLVGLGLYALTRLLAVRAGRRPAFARTLALGLLPIILAGLVALLLAAAQLAPTVELNGLGLRTGGLPYRLAVSFSLRPRLLAQSLLPPYGGDLGAAFGSEGYAEFVGYLGVAALGLAVLGAVRRPGPGAGRRGANAPLQAEPADGMGGSSPSVAPGGDRQKPEEHRADPRWPLVTLSAAGLLLALGAYDPLYYVLWRFVPGFALFRAPRGWLELYALGMAGLAGLGLDVLIDLALRRSDRPANAPNGRPVARFLRRFGPGLALVPLLALLAYQQYPRWQVVAGWLLAALVAAALVWLTIGSQRAESRAPSRPREPGRPLRGLRGQGPDWSPWSLPSCGWAAVRCLSCRLRRRQPSPGSATRPPPCWQPLPGNLRPAGIAS